MRRKIFLTHFLTLIIPVTIPVFIFGILSLLIYKNSLIEDVNERTLESLNFSKDTIDVAFSDMGFNKTLIDSNPQLNLTIFQILRDGTSSYENTMALKYIYPYLNATSNSKPYIHSVYIAMGEAGFFLMNGSKEKLSDYPDAEWYESFKTRPEALRFWTELRKVRNNGFAQDRTAVVSTYERIIHGGVLVINVRQDFFNTMLDSIKIFPSQAILVLNEANEILFFTKGVENLPSGLLAGFRQTPLDRESAFFTQGDYFVTELPSKRYNFKFVSFIPKGVIYRIPYLFLKATAAAAVLSLLVSSLLAFSFTRKNYRQILAIMKTFELAERGEPLPAPVHRENDPYSVILDNVVKSFIDQSYTKIQLSERKYRLITAQLSALQYQINPHFLFNALQSISFEVMNISGGQSIVTTMIGHLSDILRYSLYEPLKASTVGEEIEVTKKYSALQKFRYDDAFETSWEVDESLLGGSTLRLGLLPLVENALHHAFRDEKAGRLRIAITVRRCPEGLVFRVSDDGKGMDPERLEAVRGFLASESEDAEPHNIGLRNTHRRLKLKYGDASGLEIESGEGKGTAVSFKIPETDQRSRS